MFHSGLRLAEPVKSQTKSKPGIVVRGVRLGDAPKRLRGGFVAPRVELRPRQRLLGTTSVGFGTHRMLEELGCRLRVTGLQELETAPVPVIRLPARSGGGVRSRIRALAGSRS